MSRALIDAVRRRRGPVTVCSCLRWDLSWETLTGAILWLILLKANGKIGKKVAVYLMIIYFMYIVSRAFLFRADF